jgi:hypothetical protein
MSENAVQIYQLILGALAVWRVTHLLNLEDGPWAIFARLRRRVATGFWVQLLDCFYCLSIWVAAPFAVLIARDWRAAALVWPGLSAAAIMLERLTAGLPPVAPGYYVEDPEEKTQVEEKYVLRQV